MQKKKIDFLKILGWYGPLKAFYATFVQINYLNINANKLDPIKYGYCSNENYILPEKPEDNIYPPTSELIPSCNCNTCTTKFTFIMPKHSEKPGKKR